ncbi:MerR family transcriptional regulator [Pygmaiobacter massiliensis]|uniref:MerR family transcriptional regulator n=1 Tax=Pygmaiobacter massiliensis TaxID=1917873 RepID=UPI000C797097|nr:helix-turn-helix domain-containing protein [Pygmaiobacter massiliensis]
MGKLYAIGEFAKLAQVSTDTLRFYDKINLLKPEETDKFSAYRYYSHSQLIKLDIIKVCRSLGLSIDTIAALFEDQAAAAFEQNLVVQQNVLREKIKSLEDAESALTKLVDRLRVFEEVKNLDGFYTRTIKARTIALSAQFVDESKDPLDNAQVFINLVKELRSNNIPPEYEGGFIFELKDCRVDRILIFEVVPDFVVSKGIQIKALPGGEVLCMRYEAPNKEDAIKIFLSEVQRRNINPAFIMDVYLINGTFDTANRQFELQCPMT